MNWISIATSVLLGLMFIGFLFGFVRNWKKSLTRFCLILASLLMGIFLSPVISAKLIDKFVTGATFEGFGLTVNFEEIVTDMMGDEQFASDLMSSNGTTTELATALLNVVLNVVAFLLIFFALFILSLLVYYIVCLVLAIRRRKNKVKVEKNGAYWGLKFVGGGIGAISAIAIAFALLMPVFGVMNICDKFLQNTNSETTASAYSSNSHLASSGLYYTEDESIGGIEGYIQTYAKIKDEYDNSFVGGFFNYTGISFMGKSAFNHLTNVSSNNLKVNVTNEVVSLIKVYNTYKKHFVQNKFDLANNESLDGILEIYSIANESEIVKSYITEFVPKFCERWLDGEKFLGIAMPIEGEYEPLARSVLEVFNTANSTRIKANIEAIIGVLKVANNNDVITQIREEKDIVQILTDSDKLVKEEVLQLSSTNELKHVLPTIMNDLVEIVYDVVVGGDANFEETELTNEQIDNLNWEHEATQLQQMVSGLLKVYDATTESAESYALIDQLANIGEAIDSARKSQIVSGPFKLFIEDFIKSDSINLEADVKQTIQTAIVDNWSNETFSYKQMFATIGETAKLAQSIVSGDGSIDIDSLADTLKQVVENEGVKETIKDIISSDVVTNLVGENETAQAMTDMLNKFVDNMTPESIDADIAAGQEIINIISDSSSGDGLVLSGETNDEKLEAANTVIENIANSSTVMELLDEATTTADSAIQSIVSDIGGDVEILKTAISENTNISAEAKEILSNLFA